MSDVELQHEKEAEAFLINTQRLRGWQEWARGQMKLNTN